jgi:hypothetical protein
MFVVISKFMVDNRNGMTESVKKAFIARSHNVDKIAGFVRMEVLSPVENLDEIWLVTYWADQKCVQDVKYTLCYLSQAIVNALRCLLVILSGCLGYFKGINIPTEELNESLEITSQLLLVR